MITLSPRKLTRGLLLVVLVLGIINLGEGYHRFLYGDVDTPMATVLSIFDIDKEDTVATWFAVMLLAASAGILAIIALLKVRAGDRFRRHWIGLASIFAFLSLDESASLHERTRALFMDWIDIAGVFYYGWVILYGALVVVFAVAYLRFLFHLPPVSRKLFALAGTVYVGGALGAEMLQGQMTVVYGSGVQTGVVTLIEELLELTGAVIFVHALMDYLRGIASTVTFSITPAGAPAEVAGEPRQPGWIPVAAGQVRGPRSFPGVDHDVGDDAGIIRDGNSPQAAGGPDRGSE